MKDIVDEIVKLAALVEQLEGYSNEKRDPDLSSGETSHKRRKDQRNRKSKSRGGPSGQVRPSREDTGLNTRDLSDPDLRADH